MRELADLVETWRRTRSPRVAELVELLGASLPEPEERVGVGRSRREQEAFLARAALGAPADLPMLVAQLTGGTSKQGVGPRRPRGAA